jgi:hypothetical protein
MPNGEESAKKRGRPLAGHESKRRNTRATRKASEGGVPAAAATVARAEKYKAIYAGFRRSRSYESLGEEHNLKARRIREIVEELRAAGIEASRVDDPWAGHTFSEDILLWLREVLNDTAEMYSMAKDCGNHAAATGALKLRLKAISELAIHLEETGRVSGHEDPERDAEDADVLAIIGQFFKHWGLPHGMYEELENWISFRVDPQRFERLKAAGPPAGWRHPAYPPLSSTQGRLCIGTSGDNPNATDEECDYYRDGTLTPRGWAKLRKGQQSRMEEIWPHDRPAASDGSGPGARPFRPSD